MRAPRSSSHEIVGESATEGARIAPQALAPQQGRSVRSGHEGHELEVAAGFEGVSPERDVATAAERR
jgi:hypothetical protein